LTGGSSMRHGRDMDKMNPPPGEWRRCRRARAGSKRGWAATRSPQSTRSERGCCCNAAAGGGLLAPPGARCQSGQFFGQRFQVRRGEPPPTHMLHHLLDELIYGIIGAFMMLGIFWVMSLIADATAPLTGRVERTKWWYSRFAWGFWEVAFLTMLASGALFAASIGFQTAVNTGWPIFFPPCDPKRATEQIGRVAVAPAAYYRYLLRRPLLGTIIYRYCLSY
jgi:hypothetical protein